MSVQELKALHHRYVDLSDRFRAVWAFHQFISSVEKIFMPEVPPRSSADFQDAYARIKNLSQNLNASEVGKIQGELDIAASHLDQLMVRQLEEDNKVPPHFLRQFFQRVKNYDEKILTQLVKFYLYSSEGAAWEPERLDKVDFLLTRLGEDLGDASDSIKLRDLRHLREILRGLWRVFDCSPPADELVETHWRSLDALRQTIEGVSSLDDLSDQKLVARYRELKHSLGDLFFHPRVLEGILEINILLHNSVRRLYQQEERRIIIDYQRIFELEREVPVDLELNEELSQFREAVERFERQLESQEVNLEDLSVIRERVRSLLPRLNEANRDESLGEPDRDTATQSLSSAFRVSAEGTIELAEGFERLMTALEETSASASPKAVAVSREIYPFRLEPREVVAYRRLLRDPKSDRVLERYIIEAAVLRIQLNEEAEEIKGILDDTAATGDGPIFDKARGTVRLANSFLSHFAHLINDSVLAGDLAETHQLQICQMRLTRDYSGLWLLAYKRFLGGGKLPGRPAS